jgi:N-carbamoyl-L-amino-acid hydrolase
MLLSSSELMISSQVDMDLTSGAGHDAQALWNICPVGMIFVPSVGGASHSPRELTEWQECVNGANTLLHTVLTMGY